MTVHTIGLEQQGVPADIAAHRRSVHASDKCAAGVPFEQRSKTTGLWGSISKPCIQTAVSLVEGRSFCVDHRRAA